ncbi:hypothetical protein ACTZGP_25435 [Pseudomonas putida]|uniref:hypothetical protein n=1 Tax=Pseudomonas putida TaxID=303 RepID=UPI003FD1EC17
MQELTFATVCQNNGVVIFDALPETEKQTGRHLHEDLLDYCLATGRQDYCQESGREDFCSYWSIKSKQMLFVALEFVLFACKPGNFQPILHFECHGDSENGLHIHASNEYVGWDELVKYIAKINQVTRNNVGVVLAACHGLQMSKYLEIGSPSPFHFLIGPQNEVECGHLQDILIEFYKKTLDSTNLQEGVATLDKKLMLFQSSEWFYQAIINFFIAEFTRAGRSALVENMVSCRVAKAGYQSRDLVRAERARAKKLVKSPQDFYRYVARIFFHNETPIPYKEIQAFVVANRAR